VSDDDRVTPEEELLVIVTAVGKALERQREAGKVRG
jgi:hypothetical protein